MPVRCGPTSGCREDSGRIVVADGSIKLQSSLQYRRAERLRPGVSHLGPDPAANLDSMPPSSEDRVTCGLCSKQTKNLLLHLRMQHDVRDAAQYKEAQAKWETERLRAVEQYKAEEAKRNAVAARRAAFRRVVDELTEQLEKGLISPADYRRRIVLWSDTHEDA